jgi:hypothetical protein
VWFDGRRGRPSAATVASVVERLRAAHSDAQPSVDTRVSRDAWIPALYVVSMVVLYSVL